MQVSDSPSGLPKLTQCFIRKQEPSKPFLYQLSWGFALLPMPRAQPKQKCLAHSRKCEASVSLKSTALKWNSARCEMGLQWEGKDQVSAKEMVSCLRRQQQGCQMVQTDFPQYQSQAQRTTTRTGPELGASYVGHQTLRCDIQTYTVETSPLWISVLIPGERDSHAILSLWHWASHKEDLASKAGFEFSSTLLLIFKE